MGKLIPDTSVVTIYRRSLTPADAIIQDANENPSPALDTKEITVEEGEWVTLDAAGKAIRLPASPGAAGLLAFPVWVSDRRDAGAALQLTVIHGVHIAKTTEFDAADLPFAAGDRLTAKLVSGKSVLKRAATGDAVVAIAEGNAAGATSEFPNGFLPYTTMNTGFVLP